MRALTHGGRGSGTGRLASLATVVALAGLAASGCSAPADAAAGAETAIPTVAAPSPVSTPAVTVTATATVPVTTRTTSPATAKATPQVTPSAAEPSLSASPTRSPEAAPEVDPLAKSETWVVRPGGYGPVSVGMRAAELEPLGWVEAVDPNYSCGAEWQNTERLQHFGLWLDLRVGDLDDLDQITVPERARTQQGLGVWSTEAELVEAYGDSLVAQELDTNAGPADTWIRFGPEGALTFILDAGGSVERVVATTGTDLESYLPPWAGC